MKIGHRLLVLAALLGFAQSALAQEGGDAPAAPEATPAAEPAAAPADAPAAEATPAATAKKISAALLLGYGLTLNDSKTGGLNAFGLGFGARGGYNITDNFYLGARFQYHLGGSKGSVKFHEMMIGVEGGYDVPVADKLVIRPEIGLGVAVSSATVSIPTGAGTIASASASSTDLYLSFGGGLFYDVAQDIFVGAHVDLPLIMASSMVVGLNLMATVGMRF